MHSTKITTLLLTALLLIPAQSSLAAAGKAGKVVYAFGDVSAVRSDGSARELKRGARFGAGDTITTRRGRAQLRFTDGGFAALQPNTEYAIEDYNFEGQADGSERSFFNLVRGGVRLVTGLIGRTNKRNFRIRTPVATIGIRGTSGILQHCSANCGELGPGTSLRGYGGEWDLASGAYTGPVKQGQATFCNGTSCFDIPGFGQRRDVDAAGDPLDEALDESDESVADGTVESNFQDGSQADPSGDPCALGGCDDEIVVALDQIGAGAFGEDGAGDTEAFDHLGVVLKGGVPVAGIVVESTNDDDFDDAPVGIIVSDVDALRLAFSSAGGDVGAAGVNLVDSLPVMYTTALREAPAGIGEGDFGLTSDGHLLHGRWTNGRLLDIEADLDGALKFIDLIELTGFQSEHFIFGADPGVMPTSGLATYGFTGGTFSTTLDGSSIGDGVTDGTLTFDFLMGKGELDMTVVHAATTYRVLGGLQLEFDRFFFEVDTKAFVSTSMYYPVSVDGFFAVPGEDAPQAAGLAYVIEKDNPILGTAGFGLTGFDGSVGLVAAVTQGTAVWAASTHHILQSAFGASLGFGYVWFAVGQTAFDPLSNPVSAIGAGDSDPLLAPGTFNVVSPSIDATRQAIPLLADFADVAGANGLLDAVPAEIADAVKDNPATLGSDTGLTSDGLLGYGRWANGNLLVQLANTSAPSDATYELVTLTGFQSEHFIGGAAPMRPGFSGKISYVFSGGTDSTAVDGSSIGNGVVGGEISFDFSFQAGRADFDVDHAGQMYSVFGPVFVSTLDNRFFGSEPFRLSAFDGSIEHPASLAGFFDTNDGSGRPEALGVSYEISRGLVSEPSIIGVAGFSSTGGASSKFVRPAASGDYVSFAHAFIDDSSMDLNSQAFDFLVGGSTNTATTVGGVVDSLSSDFHSGLCTPSCDYSADRPGFVQVDSTGPGGSSRHVEFNTDWARFTPHSITHAQTTDNGLGTAHVLIARNVTPLTDVPAFGSGLEGTYNVLEGGSTPTVIFETGGTLQTEVEGTLDTAELIVTFDTGDVTGNFAGTFPDGGSGGTWSLNGSSSTFDRTDLVHSLSMSGTVMSPNVSDPSTSMPDCGSGCTLFGHTHYDFVGGAAEGVAGSLQGNTDTFSYPAFTIQNVYVLGGVIGPAPM